MKHSEIFSTTTICLKAETPLTAALVPTRTQCRNPSARSAGTTLPWFRSWTNHVSPTMLEYWALRLAWHISILSVGSFAPNTGRSSPGPPDEQRADKIFANLPIIASRHEFPPSSFSDGEISIQHNVQIPEHEKDWRKLNGVGIAVSLDERREGNDHAGSAASRSSSIHIASRSSDC